MKYFFIILILVFSLNSIAEEKKLEHFCKMNTKFYETDKNEWSQKMINIFTFNKITKYAKYSNTYFDEQGGGQIGVGKCYTKTI